MEFTGIITADAKINTVKGDRQVVNFSVAINDRYKPKGATEARTLTTYVNIAWWMGTGISKILRKGAVVTVCGRLFVNAYKDMAGEAKGSINCHADTIRLVKGGKAKPEQPTALTDITEPVEDLPF